MTEDGSTTVPTTAPATVTVLRWDIPISLLRLLVVALAATSRVLTAARLRRGPRRQPRQIFGQRLVHAINVDPGDRPVDDVDEPEVLRRFASLYDTVVVQVVRSDQQAFFVTAHGTP